MKTRRIELVIVRVIALLLCVLMAVPVPIGLARTLEDKYAAVSGAPVQAETGRAGVTQTIHGVTATLAELRSRAQAVPLSTPRQASPRRTFNGLPLPAPIQGVDSFNSLSTGYAIAVNETETPRAHLTVWQINDPGTVSPTISSPTEVAISPENGALGGVLTANNEASTQNSRAMDDIDDRLFAAVIRGGHLWTTHNIAVDSTGSSNSGTRNREGQRWYDITVSGPTLN